jgi:hypothetical protein
MSITEQNSPTRIVVPFPSFGWLDEETGDWCLQVRGKMFADIDENYRGRLLVGLLRRFMKVDSEDLDCERFRERARCFLAKPECGKQVAVRLGSHVHALQNKSRPNGHFSGQLTLSQDAVKQLVGVDAAEDWLKYDVLGSQGEEHLGDGRIRLVPPTGVSVISDIDDTLKHTDVTRRREMLMNTFLNDFQPISGMPDLYREWEKNDAVFHYVSSSPWQLYLPLEEFRRAANVPVGTFHLKAVRFRDPTILRLFIARRLGKFRTMKSILKTFPRRRFVLVGDSGEKDPEIYAALARKYPAQVARIFIRDLPERRLNEARCERAFRTIPREVWRVFEDPSELTGLFPSW